MRTILVELRSCDSGICIVHAVRHANVPLSGGGDCAGNCEADFRNSSGCNYPKFGNLAVRISLPLTSEICRIWCIVPFDCTTPTHLVKSSRLGETCVRHWVHERRSRRRRSHMALNAPALSDFKKGRGLRMYRPEFS